MRRALTSSRLGDDKAARSSGILGRAVAAVRRVAPTYENAERLWIRYVESLKDDLALLRLVQDAGRVSRGVDGMTELLSCADLFNVLCMSDCATLEIPHANVPAGPPAAFVMVPYAAWSPQSVEQFRTYFLGTVFDPSRLHYLTTSDERALHAALNEGNVAYLADFVSPSNPAATIALLIACHVIIVDETFKAAKCTLLGKCLESVRIGEHRNDLGNQRIKQLAASFQLERIGEAYQERELELICEPGLRPPDAPFVGHKHAELVFGLYLGDSAGLAPLARRYREFLHASIVDDV